MRAQVCGLRGRKREATRLALGAAAVELISERGLQVTVDEIADRAGVSPRTFFNYFSCKEEAVTVGHASKAQAFIQALLDRPAHEPIWESLRLVTRDALAILRIADGTWIAEAKLASTNPTVMAQILLHQHDQELLLAEAIRQRPEFADQPLSVSRLVAALWSGAIRAAVDTWVERSDHQDLADLVDSVFRTLAKIDLAPIAR